MPVSSALDLIKMSLKTAGVLAIGQTVQAEDANDALTMLNGMLAAWNQNRWLIYHLLDIVCPSVVGKQFYTVGPNGDFNVVRPDNIEFAYIRLLNKTSGSAGLLDFPLGNIETYEEYAAIGLKSLQSFPNSYFYDPTLTLGRFFILPIPVQAFDIHIVVKDTLGDLGLTDKINLPPEYYDALLWNMAGRLQLLYNIQPTPGIVQMANASLTNIKVANHRVPNLDMPPGLSRSSGTYRSQHGMSGVIDGIFTLDEDVLG